MRINANSVTYICIYIYILYKTKIILSLFISKYSHEISKLKYLRVQQHVTNYGNFQLAIFQLKNIEIK